ncbi:hypothetical protein K5X82_01535 [Halosquirtibacter xylanolyticus]|uniref:hypothetical protein n=1 Tax=Halosquirtibacter xylanolyticus TaxID=3374599 RepID=UPI0037479F5F|nr:hypothetical protein K5X82_01535 [Prolixibacteraceae bacterium]
MVNLSTKYMGIPIETPIVLGASNLPLSPNIIMDAVCNGVGAVIYPTLFEEVALMEEATDVQKRKFEDRQHQKRNMFPFVRHGDLHAHLSNVRDLVKRLNAPVIGSLNCVHFNAWESYAKALQDQGVKGLELNYSLPNLSWSYSSRHTEQEQYRVIERLKSVLDIPVSVKLSPYYTNLLHHVKCLDKSGADAIIFFGNPMFPDIDTQTESLICDLDITSEAISPRVYPFIGKVYPNTVADLIGAGGVRNGYDVIKMILSGASAVQTVSTIYRHKLDYLSEMLTEIKEWMFHKNYDRLEDFKGLLSFDNKHSRSFYTRKGYVDIMVHSATVPKKYPMSPTSVE